MDTEILSLNEKEIEQYVTSNGEPKFRARQIFSSVQNGRAIDEISNISVTLKNKLKTDFNCEPAKIENEITSKDGTKKILLRLLDGNFIECVLLFQDYGNTVCVSSQVGCKMNCGFCASAVGGFIRNLSAGEIMSQVLTANKFARISHIVIMGIGEPFDNFDNTIKFLSLVTDKNGLNIGARNISVSTCGLPDKIRAFADLGLQVNLCISLHAPNDDIRRQIMPIAKSYPIREVMQSAKYFFDKTKRRVIFEYCMIDNVNCQIEHARELSFFVKNAKISAHINLINLIGNVNGFEPPSHEKAKQFMDTLIKNGISCTMRKGKGNDIMAACGQLRLRFTG